MAKINTMVPWNLAQLPHELVISMLAQEYPARHHQLRSLATLTHVSPPLDIVCYARCSLPSQPDAAPCRNCIVYGIEATGKTAVVASLLQRLSASPVGDENATPLHYAIINSLECVTGRHLFETTLRKVAQAVASDSSAPRCENLAQLTFELSKLLKHAPPPGMRGFVLVFDAIDRQREAPPTLLPALARLSEIVSRDAVICDQSRQCMSNADWRPQIPCLTTVFILTNPPPNALLTTSVAYVHFANYTKADFVKILSTTTPATLPNATAAETTELWARFCGAVHDALVKSAARSLPALQLACDSLWRRFTAPIREGNLGPKDFSKLLIAARVHFQDESLLDPSITRRNEIRGPPSANPYKAVQANKPTTQQSGTSLAELLPTTARILLIAAYLASHNATKHDLTLFSTYHHGKRKRRGGGLSVAGGAARSGGPRSKHRKIARKLLGAHAFVLERMLAVFTTVRNEWGVGGSSGSGSGLDADVSMALATLSSLRLLVRVGGGGDPLDRGGKWRVNVGWEVVRGLGRSMGIEVEEWLVE